MQFSAHGSYKIEKEGSILLVDAQGPFNEVTAKKYHQDVEIYTQKMSDAPWGSLISFEGNSVFTPDAERLLIETTHYRMENGMIAIAAIIGGVAYADILQMQLQRIYQSCHITVHFFSDTDNAKAWLNSFINEHTESVVNI
jgi:hypothetical protein